MKNTSSASVLAAVFAKEEETLGKMGKKLHGKNIVIGPENIHEPFMQELRARHSWYGPTMAKQGKETLDAEMEV